MDEEDNEFLDNEPIKGNFEEIANYLDVKEGQLVIKRVLANTPENSDYDGFLGDYVDERTYETELVKVVKLPSGNFTLGEPFMFPKFSADQEELENAIEDIGGVEIVYHGRSGFKTRNRYEIKPAEKNTEYELRVIDVSYEDGMPIYKTFYDTEKIVGYSNDDVARVNGIIETAKENVAEIRRKRFLEKFNESSIDGMCGIVSKGGYQEEVIVPEDRYIMIAETLTAYTADHRTNTSHTYTCAYLDVEAIRKSIENGEVQISIDPENFGFVAKKMSFGAVLSDLRAKEIDAKELVLYMQDSKEKYEELGATGGKRLVRPKIGSYDNLFNETAKTLGVSEGELVLKQEKYGEKTSVLARVTNQNGIFQLMEPFEFPSFPANKKELKKAISQQTGFVIETEGESGFASRNTCVVKPEQKTKEYDGLKCICQFGDLQYMLMSEDGHTVDYSQEDVDKANEYIEKANETVKKARTERFQKKFMEGSMDGVFGIIAEGGYEESVSIPQEQFIEYCRVKTRNTQDRRQGLSHTEDVCYLNIEAAKQSVRNGKLDINVPESIMGMLIGKGGANINGFTELLKKTGVDVHKIILHPHSTEKWELNLSQIKNAIELQRNVEGKEDKK